MEYNGMNFRVSFYTILVRLEDGLDKYMLLHGYTGAVDIVDKYVATYLQEQKNTFCYQEIPFDEDTRQVLLARGYITSRTKNEEFAYVQKMATILYKKSKMLYTHFTFVVTYDCNFRCPYCFEKGTVSGEMKSLLFTQKMVDKAYQAILEIQPNEKLRPKVITLFGGEPLLTKNKEIVHYIVKKGQELGFTFYAVTNGYEIDDFVDLIGPNGIVHLQVTIDGIKSRHNSKRIHMEKIPTFDKIVANIGLALQRGAHITIRVNTDKSNIGDLNALKELFDKLHYTDNSNFTIESAILRNCEENVNNDKKNNFFTMKEFVQEHKDLNYKYGCKDFGVYANIYNAITKKSPLHYRSVFCGAQTASYVFDPVGNIYPCWEVIGTQEHKIGNYMVHPISWDDKVINKWRNTNILVFNNCKQCKYALLCGGDCSALKSDKNKCNHLGEIIKYAVQRAYSIV